MEYQKYEIYCKRMEELIQLIKDYPIHNFPTQPVAAMIIDENNQVIAQNIKTMKLITNRGFNKKKSNAVRSTLHAEQRVLEEAGKEARGKTLITTLEPCIWRKSGKSCSELIVDAGLAKVVYGCEDVRQKNRAREYLEEHKIEVIQLEEYKSIIAQYTNAHRTQRIKKIIESINEEEKISELQEQRKILRKEGKLGYKRPETKREFNQILRRYLF